MTNDSGGKDQNDRNKNDETSSKKEDANRHNAQSSTGPKTERGKSHSRMNALKHGVLASALLVAKGGGAEDASEFEELLCGLNKDLAPVGRLEEMMVEKIAVCWWRQKRALRYEALMIRRSSGEVSPAVCQKQQKVMEKLDNYFHNEVVAEQAIKDLQRYGLTGEDLKEPAVSEKEARAKKMLELLREQVTEGVREKAIYHFGLPADAEMNRILRYETSIQRQLAHAINQLERLQRARKGEHVPAPVTLQVSTDH